jgi:hypothetical protein
MLLAWPWNVVLSTAESTQIAHQYRLEALRTQGSPRDQHLVRSGWWNPRSGSVFALDYDRDEEDGDDVSPLSLPSDLSPIEFLGCADPAASSVWSPVCSSRPVIPKHPYRLRC